MHVLRSFRLQLALMAILFVGSLAALVFNVFAAIVPRQRELHVRDELRETSRQMAAAAADTAGLNSVDRNQIDGLLAAISERYLSAHPGLDGGFYLGPPGNRFSGFYAAGGGPAPPKGDLRSDPPPMEAPLIRAQAQQSLALSPGAFLLSSSDVGPSRVAILTEPVGQARPARLATWVMYRLVDPRDLPAQVRRYQLSTGLSLGGLAAAVLLAWNMNRLVRRQNAEREHLQQELRRSEHLAALGTLVAGVAHEVRNPLAAIRSTVQLWQRLPHTVENRDSVTAVVAAVDRINQIVSQLLQFSRTGGEVREILDVRQLVCETLDLVAAQCQDQSVRIERQLEDRPAWVDASGQALRQVVLNLVTNALQAMPDGGVLTCRIQCSDETVVVSITDTGPGMSSEVRKHLFEPFFTTREEGTGLGLAICREIVTRHAGRIELADNGGPGARFYVVLPLAKEHPGQPG